MAAARAVVWANGLELHLDAYFLWSSYDSARPRRHHRSVALRIFVYYSRMATRSHLGAALCPISRMAVSCDSFERGNCCTELTKKGGIIAAFLFKFQPMAELGA